MRRVLEPHIQVLVQQSKDQLFAAVDAVGSMTKLIIKGGCYRCEKLVAALSEEARKQVIQIHGTKCCGFVGLGDVVEAIIYLFQLHKVWAWLHRKPTNWVCPGCQRRKNWLNLLWYFGDKQSKGVLRKLLADTNLPDGAEYPFLMFSHFAGAMTFFGAIPGEVLDKPWLIETLLTGDNQF